MSARVVFSRAVFPVVLFGGVAVAIHAIESGVGPAQALLCVQLTSFATVALCERIFPHHRSWNRSQRDVRVDAAHTVTIAALTMNLQPLLRLAGVGVAMALSGVSGGALGLWPSAWPLALQLAVALVVGEFFEYWVHRWEHEHEGLWRIHAMHHSAPRLYWLNAGRFHPFDIALVTTSSYLPLVILGAGPEVLALRGLVLAVHGIFQHANLALELGPLNWIFSMAELHRWHHSRLVEESNRNYGQTLIVWDTVFGTRFLPRDREPPEEIGIPDLPDFPMTYFAQLASPFRWRAITARRPNA